MIFTRETNPAASYRSDGSPADTWDYLDMRDALDRRAVTLGERLPIPQFPTRPSGQTVAAYVNHGRWLWDCPTCGNTYQATIAGRAFCTNCWNANTGWHQLAYPVDRGDIERALDARVDPATRNWLPGETVAALVLENAQHGGPT